MSKIVGDSACPSCRANGRDSAGNHLIHFEDGGRWCNRCGHTEKPNLSTNVPNVTHTGQNDTQMHPIRDNSRTQMEEIATYPVQALPDRMIKASVCERYGVRVSLSETDGTIESHYYPVYVAGSLAGYKVRNLPKNFRSVGACKGTVQLFGQQLFSGGKKLLITGGELDALSAYQMLHDKYPGYEPSVVSLPKGENISAVSDNMSWVEGFEEVLIYTDMDEPGRKCAKELANLIGPKARIVTTSLKDASDMLVGGLSGEFINAFFSAKPFVPDGFVSVDDVYEKATAMPQWGRLWPWPSLSKLTFGRRNGEGIYVGAGVKCGKSSLVDQFTHHVTKTEGAKIALFKLEEDPAMTVRKVAGIYKRKPFHRPDGNFTQQELIDGVNEVRGKVLLYDSVQATTWERLKGAIRHAVIVEGCQDIVIDPLTRLTVGLDAAQTNTELERIADELASMSKDLGFFYMVCCHLRAPQTGKPHELGGQVQSSQFTGSRAMMRACYYMLGIERNKDPELDEIKRNTSTFVLLEDRAFGNIGRFSVFYNRDTGEYLEPNLLQGAF